MYKVFRTMSTDDTHVVVFLLVLVGNGHMKREVWIDSSRSSQVAVQYTNTLGLWVASRLSTPTR